MQRFRQNSSNGFGGDVITVEIKDGGHICLRTGNILWCAQLHHKRNISGKFKKNLTSGLGGDVIMRL